MSDPLKKLNLRFIVPALILAGCAGLWGWSSSATAVPGTSASLLYQHIGPAPFQPLDKIVWGWLAMLLSAGGAHPGVLNLFSTLCGAASIALLYVVMTRLPTSFAPAPVVERQHVVTPVRALGAVLASVYLAVSLPFWIVSTRASSSPLDILLLLVSIYCLFRFRMSRRLLWAWFSCLTFAVCLTGFGTLFAIAPFYGVVLAVYLVQNGLMRVRNILALSSAGLIGLMPWLIKAMSFMASPGYAWREFTGLQDVMFYMLREEYHGFKNAALQTGWLIIFMVSVLPWLIVVVFRLGQNRKIAPTSRVGGFILNTLLTVIGVLVALDISFVAPWRYGNPQDPMVTPYLLVAMWFGGLGSFWYFELIHHEAGNNLRRPVWQKPLGFLMLAAMFGTVAASAVRNFPIVDGRPARLAQEFVNQTIANLDGREWFITTGTMDENIILAIREKNLPIRTLSLPLGNSSAYLKYVATLFPDTRLRGLAQVGLVPLFSEWVATDPAAAGKIAIQNMPDLWYAAGKEPQPQSLLYVAQTKQPATPEDLLKRHEQTWAALKAANILTDPENPIAPYNRWILGHTARVANNLGVHLEETARPDLARRAYEEALTFDTNNISAKLNLYNIYRVTTNPAAPALNAELETVLKKTDLRRAMWALAYHYGFVRRPEAYAERGWAFALTGKPNLGLSELNRIRQMTGDSPGLNLVMANLQFQQDRPEDSAQSYLNVLKQDPTNINARVGLFHVALLRQQFDEARSQLQRLRELKAPPQLVQMEEAALESTVGNPDKALKILTTLTKDYPEYWLAWTALALTAHETGDLKTTETAQTRLTQARNLPVNIRIALASLCIKQKDNTVARRHLEAALQQNPQNIQVLEMLIRIEIQERHREATERHIQRLLSINARNPLANYALGSIQVFNGQYALAEASYRVALEGSRTPDVLNDLAWSLALQTRYKDAEPFAKESVAKQPRNGNAWDTLGFIQLKLGDLAAADQSLQKAAALLPGYTSVLYHIALVYEARGMAKESLNLATQLLARAAELDRETQDNINLLMKRLRSLP